MKALIIQTMLALLIPGLSNTPKQALTPPTTFDYSYKLQGPPGADAIWHFKNESTGLYSSIYWTRTSNDINGFDYDTGYLNLAGFTDIEWRLRTYYTDSAMFLVGGSYYEPWYNYIGTTYNGASIKYRFEFSNLSKYNYLLYLDFSSTNSNFYNILYYSAQQGVPYTTTNIFGSSSAQITNNAILIPAFSVVNMYHSSSTLVKLDALYFDKLPITQGMGGYGQENYNEGYMHAYDEFGNFDWLSSLFTTMGDLLAIEILPGITIGLILLIPIVFGVLRFIMGLFR